MFLLQLIDDLAAASDADARDVDAAIALTVDLANRSDRRTLVRRRLARSVAHLDFARCTRALLSSRGSEDLRELSPGCDAEAVLDAAASACVLFGRLVARRFAASKAEVLADSIRGGSQVEIALAADACVEALVAKRVTLDRSPSAVSTDPRYLVFEMASSLVLREQQLELVKTFRIAITKGSGLVHQMLMGQGKTTVVAPLLALCLADGEKLLTSVSPRPLVEMRPRCKIRSPTSNDRQAALTRVSRDGPRSCVRLSRVTPARFACFSGPEPPAF